MVKLTKKVPTRANEWQTDDLIKRHGPIETEAAATQSVEHCAQPNWRAAEIEIETDAARTAFSKHQSTVWQKRG
jgi:hypothetical protein